MVFILVPPGSNGSGACDRTVGNVRGEDQGLEQKGRWKRGRCSLWTQRKFEFLEKSSTRDCNSRPNEIVTAQVVDGRKHERESRYLFSSMMFCSTYHTLAIFLRPGSHRPCFSPGICPPSPCNLQHKYMMKTVVHGNTVINLNLRKVAKVKRTQVFHSSDGCCSHL